MTSEDELQHGIKLRPARPGEGQQLYDITAQSIKALGKAHYSGDELANWMGNRTAAYYEDVIAKNRTFVAEQDGVLLGFVDADRGEVTRLFLVPEAAGRGLGRALLQRGIEVARMGHQGPVRVESTLNAQGFYESFGFKPVSRGYFSHGVGGEPIDIVIMEMR
ncbi:GNAT family N-acetyltransferase [Agrobacterium sp. fls2-241-TYG-188a]|uniref:GNAT family N-acetyltransferase n=1 Tax=Agrobacterium sp. fls2-241-TYG-188a TaxID=3040275 RepID=UPI00254C128B|nr:GNAT family N-acetyltransferase [Agrobacterium sp. fls2-241-TYG-188a]